VANAQDWFVSATGDDSAGDGLSWDTAYRTIQKAVDSANIGEWIAVGDGTYEPFDSGNLGVLIESFNGAAVTFIDGGNSNRCATLGSAAGENNTVLRGFTLLNGFAPDGFGGGVQCGTLSDCTITGCVATNNGGGAYWSQLTACNLSGNEATENGGGAADSWLLDCVLEGNKAKNGGGAFDSNLSGCTLASNEATENGGGAFDSTLFNSTLTDNAATSGGGAHSANLTECIVTGNTSAQDGGGVFWGWVVNSQLTGNIAQENGGAAFQSTLESCLVEGNTAAMKGGGASESTLINVTLVKNQAAAGGGVYDGNIFNTILWENTPNNSASSSAGSISFANSTNAPAAEVFVDAANGDYRLRAGSACIDAGGAFSTVATDLDGNPRINTETTSLVDMGAYEFYAPRGVAVTFDPNNWMPWTETRMLTNSFSYGKLGALPTPDANIPPDGTSFVGWFTAAVGGTQVTEDTMVRSIAPHTLFAQWRLTYVTVSFRRNVANGIATETTPALRSLLYTPTFDPARPVPIDGIYGELGDLPVPTCDGYTFVGWYTAANPTNALGELDENLLVTSNTICTNQVDHQLFAQWQGNQYTVTFEKELGSVVDPDSITVTLGKLYGPLPDPFLDAYVLEAWCLNNAATQIFADTRVTTTNNHHLFPAWMAYGYTVNFDANGGTGEMADQRFGMGQSKLLTTLAFERTGYTFGGWTNAAAGGAVINPAFTVVNLGAQNTTVVLAAVWNPISYTILFDRNGGQGAAMPAQNFVYDVEQALRANTYVRPGVYRFDGWTNALGQAFTDGQVVVNLASVNNTTNTFYALWVGQAYVVTFDAQGGAVDPLTMNARYGTPFGPLPVPTQDGFTFGGWFTLADGLGEQITEDSYMNWEEPLTLFALWTPGEPPEPPTDPDYSIVFNSGTGETAEQFFAAAPAVSMDLNLNTFVRAGYSFVNWTDEEGTTYADGATVVIATMQALANEDGVVTLTANWVANDYVVTFDVGSGEGTFDAITVTFGQAYGDLPAPTHADPLTKFEGWFTEADGLGTLVDAATLVATAADHTLFAFWVAKPPYLEPEGEEEGPALSVNTAYDGFVYDAANTVRGTLTVSAKVSKGLWTVSAKAILQGATVSFSGKKLPSVANIVMLAKGGETLTLALDRDRLDGTLEGGKVGFAGTVCGAKNDQMDRLGGLYNVALDNSGTQGYLSLTVGKKNAVKFAGLLADGSKVSGSTKLLKGLSVYNNWYGITLFKPLYKKAGFIGGLLWLDPQPTVNSPNQSIIRVDTEYEWYVDWKKPTETILLDVIGGYFGSGKSVVSLPTGNFTFIADVPADLPTLGSPWLEVPELTANNGGTKLSFDKKGATNPAGATLSYNAKTGVFKGKLPLLYTDTKGKGKANNAAYVGVMVPVPNEDTGKNDLTGLGVGVSTINKVKYGIPVYLTK